MASERDDELAASYWVSGRCDCKGCRTDLARVFARVRAEGVKAERAEVVAHMRKVTLPFREREEKVLHDMASVIESGMFHVTPREAKT